MRDLLALARIALVSLVLLAVVVLRPLCVRSAAADTPAAPPTELDDALADAPGRTAFAPTRPRPEQRERLALRIERLEQSRELRRLRERLAAAAPAERAGLQRELEATKREHEARVLALRAEQARRAGAAEAARVLESRAASLRALAPVGTPAGPARDGGAR